MECSIGIIFLKQQQNKTSINYISISLFKKKKKDNSESGFILINELYWWGCLSHAGLSLLSNFFPSTHWQTLAQGHGVARGAEVFNVTLGAHSRMFVPKTGEASSPAPGFSSVKSSYVKVSWVKAVFLSGGELQILMVSESPMVENACKWLVPTPRPPSAGKPSHSP